MKKLKIKEFIQVLSNWISQYVREACIIVYFGLHTFLDKAFLFNTQNAWYFQDMRERAMKGL